MKKLLKTQQSHFISNIAFSPNGQNIVTANQDGMVLIYDLNGNALNQVRTYSETVRRSMGLFPDGKSLITGGINGLLKQYSLPDLELITEFEAENTTNICFSPDGEMFAMGHSHSRKATLWDKSLNLMAEIKGIHQDWVEGIAFAPDSQTLLTTSHDGTFGLWNTKERMLVKDENRYICRDILQGEAATDIIYDAAFSPDGSAWGIACQDGYARLLSTKTADCLIKLLHENKNGYIPWVQGINFSNNEIVRTLTDDTINFWDVQGVLMEWYHPAEQMRCFAFSDNLMAVGCYDGTVGLWEF